MENTVYDLKQQRKIFSTIGFALSAIVVVGVVAQVAFVLVPELIWGEDNWFKTSSWGFWISSFAPIYLFAIPAGLLIMRKIPAHKPEEHKLGAGKFFVLLPITYFVMYAGNIIGNILSIVLSGGQAENALIEYAMDDNPLKFIVMVILAPILEELVFRKQLIDRTRQYGEKLAVVLSGLAFGLLHQNLYQFFYAFGIGVIFAYVYLRTGRLRYTVLMHAILNFFGSVVASWVLKHLDLDALSSIGTTTTTEDMMTQLAQILPGLMIYLAYALFIMIVSITGLVLMCTSFRKVVWKNAENELPKGTTAKTVYANTGMIVYTVLCAVFIVIALFK